MAKNFILFAIILIVATSCNIANAKSSEGFNAWLKQFEVKAARQGISKATVRNALGGVTPNQKVISLDKKQPEFKKRYFKDYKAKVVSAGRIKQGRKLLNKHYKLLDEIEKKFGVQKRFIVALWGAETNYGRYTGGFNIPRSLASLAYDGRRKKFFEKELINALKILEEGHIKNAEFTGSWAGALGQCQFMPSSFFAYAVDYNRDGKKDIWNDKADIFASIANYLKTEGWRGEYTWGRRVNLPSNLRHLVNEKSKKMRPLSYFKRLGVIGYGGAVIPNVDIKARLVAPDGNDGDYSQVYLVYSNYNVIMHWNRSTYFATSIGLLADSLR